MAATSSSGEKRDGAAPAAIGPAESRRRAAAEADLVSLAAAARINMGRMYFALTVVIGGERRAARLETVKQIGSARAGRICLLGP